jgi:glycosyltransferase involved in cell wall biosynthesis
MRIVIFNLNWSHGIEGIVANLTRELEKHADVTVISGQKPAISGAKKAARSDKYTDAIRQFVNPLVYIRILARIRQCNPQVIYFMSPHVLNAPLTLLCRWFSAACVIVHVHDAEYARSSPVARFADAVARLQSRFAHRVYCYGAKIKCEVIKNFKVPAEHIATFRLGPSHWTRADVATAAPKPSPRQFSMIGTLIYRKGVEYFLEAARLFNERHGASAAQFVLAGSGDISRYKAAIERLPNLVVMNRFVEDAEVNELLTKSYASVLPYIEGVMQSSFVAIAYGNGCPVIVSDIGSLPEEVENGGTGYVVEKGNAAQIAEAMTKIYSEREESRLFENCLRAYREKFSWEQIGEQIFRDMERSAELFGDRPRDAAAGRERRFIKRVLR